MLCGGTRLRQLAASTALAHPLEYSVSHYTHVRLCTLHLNMHGRRPALLSAPTLISCVTTLSHRQLESLVRRGLRLPHPRNSPSH